MLFVTRWARHFRSECLWVRNFELSKNTCGSVITNMFENALYMLYSGHKKKLSTPRQANWFFPIDFCSITTTTIHTQQIWPHICEISVDLFRVGKFFILTTVFWTCLCLLNFKINTLSDKTRFSYKNQQIVTMHFTALGLTWMSYMDTLRKIVIMVWNLLIQWVF